MILDFGFRIDRGKAWRIGQGAKGRSWEEMMVSRWEGSEKSENKFQETAILA